MTRIAGSLLAVLLAAPRAAQFLDDAPPLAILVRVGPRRNDSILFGFDDGARVGMTRCYGDHLFTA